MNAAAVQAEHDALAEQFDQVNRLRIVLMALLPKDGTPMTVASLAKVAGCTNHAVTDALFDVYLAEQIDFDVLADTFSAKKRGNVL